jgi:Fe-S-cluster containining protein
MTSRNLSGNWISTLIDHQKLYNETIKIRQDGNNINASIKLPYYKKTYDYEFDGKINNNIVHGIYYSKNYKTETGTLSFRSINNNILYGFCTFVDESKPTDITQSPYLLIRNKNTRLGTYNFCKNCVGKEKNCCCHPKIDMPIILPFEVERIKRKFNVKTKYFAELINLVYRMKRNLKTDACIFYQNNQCQIYSDRPLDCRLFPYDFKIDKNKNLVLINYSKSICQKYKPNKTLKDQSYTIRPLLNFFRPYIHQCSDKKLTKRLTKNKHLVLYKMKDIF